MRNLIGHNTKACPPSEEEEIPALSGLGVVLFGASGVTVTRNDIVGNRPSGPSFFSAGVGVVSADGSAAPRRNTVERNLIRNNALDILWDRTGQRNVFTGNDCRTSEPKALARAPRIGAPPVHAQTGALFDLCPNIIRLCARWRSGDVFTVV